MRKLLTWLTFLLLSAASANAQLVDDLPRELATEPIAFLLYDEVRIDRFMDGSDKALYEKHNSKVRELNEAIKKAEYPYPHVYVLRSQLLLGEDLPPFKFVLESPLMEAFNDFSSNHLGKGMTLVADILVYDVETKKKYVLLPKKGMGIQLDPDASIKYLCKGIDRALKN